MNRPRICLTLTGRTLSENASVFTRYRDYVDMVELRADYLDEDECFYLRRFPAMVDVPCVLTIRRTEDGGKYDSGEINRTMLFGKALAFAADEEDKNFAYVDFEEDFHVPSLQDAALAFGIKIIRSFHDMHNPVYNIKDRCNSMRKTGYEIPKLAFMPHTIKDVENLFRQAADMPEYDHILCAMGPLGASSRILSCKLNSYLTYVSPEETQTNTSNLGHMDPITLNNIYGFKSLNKETEIFGVVGWPLVKTRSPEIHNAGYKAHGMNKVFIPVRSERIEDAISFAKQLGIKGLAVTVPFKSSVMKYLTQIDEAAEEIGACNTVMQTEKGWIGCNTDAGGFKQALEEFLGAKKIDGKKVAIIGAGGAARAIAYVIHEMGADACVFNRTIINAKKLAEEYGFNYASLDPRSIEMLESYSDIIIQTTSVGMNSNKSSNEENDPIYFYSFKGTEMVFDIVYVPEITPIMMRAKEAGCEVCNGMKMLDYQGHRQFKFFTGSDYKTVAAENQ